MPQPSGFPFTAALAPAAALSDPSVTAQVVRDLRAAAADAEGVATRLRQAANAIQRHHVELHRRAKAPGAAKDAQVAKAVLAMAERCAGLPAWAAIFSAF